MADQIKNIIKQEHDKEQQKIRDLKNKFSESVVTEYQKHPFKLDSLKDAIRQDKDIKTYTIYDFSYNQLGDGDFSHELMNNLYDIAYYGTKHYEDAQKNGCYIVKRFFEKANKDNNWNFKTIDNCNSKQPSYDISW